MAEQPLSDRARSALADHQKLEQAHQEFVDRYARNRRAYEGVLEQSSEAAQWTHKHAPPYAEHIIETTIASMLDEQLRFRVRPSPRMFMSAEEAQQVRDSAKAWQILLSHQLKDDRFDEKQRPFVMQDRIGGLSVAKVYWNTQGVTRRRTTWSLDPLTGMAVWDTVEEPAALRDGPCVEVVDVGDFFWDDQAASLEDCPVVTHRVWPTLEECRRMEERGVWRNVGDLPATEIRGGSLDEGRDAANRKPGRIEVLEIWRRERGRIRVYTVGNRKVPLAERDNPFDHGELPFVLFRGQPRPFRIVGRAQVEKIAAIQAALWSVLNQRLDNLMFLNNAIHIVNEDLVDDVDAAEWYPGARWLAHGDANAAYQMWSPNPVPAQISIPAESMMKADMQNLAGGFPFTSSSEAQTVNASTATEASLVASLAQRSIIGAKRHLYESYRRIGQQMIWLNQQFTREPVYAVVVGANDTFEQKEILPWMLEGDFTFDVEPMTESLMRQERRSEMLSLFQALMPSVQIGAMTGAPLNTRRLYERVLETFDEQDIDGWFAQPQGAPAQPGGIPGMGTPPNPENQAQGQTNPVLAAGPLSVSNGNSLAPGSMGQQMMADNTPRNV